jgi:hypothetical protein
MVSIMPPRLQVPNNFKFKFLFFGGQILEETLAPNQSFSFDVLESSHIQVNKETNTKTLN